MKTALLALGTAAVLLLGACNPATEATGAAGHEGHGGAAGAAEEARHVEVTASSFSFASEDLTLGAGEEVAIALTTTDVAHDFVVEGTDFHLFAEPGDTATGGLRIDKPGSYTAYCSVPGHREAGMETTITVAA